MDYEIVVIGAGVIGLACAEYFSGKNSNVLIVDRHTSFGWETSSRNSEVIHAGIYYPTGTLKAQLCVAGNKSIYEWCNRYDVPYKRIGKYIIAVTKDEIVELESLFRQAKNNGVENIILADINTFHSEEPNVTAVAALWSPDTGIIDSHKLMESFAILSKENGCDFAYKHEVIGISKENQGFKLTIKGPENEIFEITSEKIINAAGLDSDTIAALAGIDIDKAAYRLHYVRGHYFRLKESKKNLVNHLIYPVPLKNLAGLGTHLTLELSGGLKLGPDIQYLNQHVQDYSVPSELQESFYRAASAYLKSLDFDDIFPDQAGIRPKLQEEGGAYRDFIIKEESDKNLPGFINLIGIESPGLTCCLEIAKKVAEFL